MERNRWKCVHCRKYIIDWIDSEELYCYITEFRDNDGNRYCEQCMEIETELEHMQW